jgi:prophage regulatory protein
MEGNGMKQVLKRLMLRLPAVTQATGKSTSAQYEDIADGLFTKGVPLGGRSVGWPSDEVDALNAARVAGWSDDQIKSLVIRLHEARKAAAAGLLEAA